MATGGDMSRPSRQNDRNFRNAHGRSAQVARVPNSVSWGEDSLASRWGLRGKKGKSMQDNPLLSAFARLRNDLRGCTGRHTGVQQLLEELNCA